MDKTVMWKLSYGLYVVGVSDHSRPCGCIINTATQITSDPVRLSISMNKDNYTHQLIDQNKKFSLAVLSTETDPLVITYLGFRSGREHDKFEDVKHSLFHELPVPESNLCGKMYCEVIDQMDAGTHTVFLADVLDGESLSSAPPMTYAYYHSVIKGSAPKNAPTYRGDV